MNSLSFEISPSILIIIGIIIIIIILVKANKTEKELRKYKIIEQQQQAALYPNRNYKAKNSAFYLMTPKQKLEYTYDRLPEKEQEKVQRYAESLLREIENQKYNQK